MQIWSLMCQGALDPSKRHSKVEAVCTSENSHTWPTSPISLFRRSFCKNIHSTKNKFSKIMAVLCHLPNLIVCHPSFLNPSKSSFCSNGALVFLRWPTSCPDTVNAFLTYNNPFLQYDFWLTLTLCSDFCFWLVPWRVSLYIHILYLLLSKNGHLHIPSTNHMHIEEWEKREQK